MRVLFLCMHMDGGYHGSVLHVLEYAEYYVNRGDDVTIGAVFIDAAIAAEAERIGVKLCHLKQVPVEQPYDLVYALHLFLFPFLLTRGLRYRHAITMLLSAFHPIEKVPPTSLWPHFDMITCLSVEAIAKYAAVGIDAGSFEIVPNHVPLAFLRKWNAKTTWNKTIGKVCVVSNRRLPELVEMARISPWRTDFYGEAHGNNVRITPEILLEYDLVITIGKTVQYALGIGIPVFEYDIHGGCGYISPGNLEEEEKTNFSGRGSGQRLGAEELRAMIESGYARAVAQARPLRAVALERYSISSLIERQLARLEGTVGAGATPVNVDTWLFANASVAALNYMFSLDSKIAALKKSAPE